MCLSPLLYFSVSIYFLQYILKISVPKEVAVSFIMEVMVNSDNLFDIMVIS